MIIAGEPPRPNGNVGPMGPSGCWPSYQGFALGYLRSRRWRDNPSVVFAATAAWQACYTVNACFQLGVASSAGLIGACVAQRLRIASKVF